jgi:hypothetical protein
MRKSAPFLSDQWPVWGAGFDPAAELYVKAGSADDLIAAARANLIFNGAVNIAFQYPPGLRT